MCGFCGFVDKMNVTDKDTYIENMMNKIIHRGPDGEGKYTDDNVALGFRRLSIIDLEEGGQPLYNEDESLVLVFNGEIYNYQSIKEGLLVKGHVFKTNTDSEVILHGFEEYGVKILDHLRGMFAFAIWDKNKNQLFGARDFFGIKPLYYAQKGNDLIFGSEIKSIIEHPSVDKNLNINALQSYLSFQYSVLKETFFSGIDRLPPAHYFIFKDGQMEINRYWEVSFDNVSSEKKPLEHYVNEIDKVFQDSILSHKVSDVEVGSFLSSGIDSSYVAASFNGDKTFTVGFAHDKYNEIDAAKELSDEIKIKNYNKVITPEEYWGSLSKIQYSMDEPLADPAAVALYFVSQLASQHVKVVLSGEGADELFGGYNIYKEPMSLKPMMVLPKFIRRGLGKLAASLPFDIKGKNYLIRASKDVEERFIGNANIFSEQEVSKLILADKFADYKKHSTQEITKPFYDKVKDENDITKMQYLDIHMWLTGDILLKADKMSMAHSLELRVPFLDKEVAKIATQIPLEYRVNKENTKYALRMAAKRKLKDKVANKKKLGFPVPIRVWLREEKYYNIIKTSFTSESAKEFFDTDMLIDLLNQHYNGNKDNSRKIWTVYSFLIWYGEYFASKTQTEKNEERKAEKILA